MADDSMDVDNFEQADAEVVGGGGGYMDDDIQIEDEDEDDDDDDDDDAPLLPATGTPMAPAKGGVKGSAPRPRVPLVPAPRIPGPKKRQRPVSLPIRKATTTAKPPSEDDPRPGDYKLRAAGMSEELREFIVAKFRDGIPSWHASTDGGEPMHVRLYRDREQTLQQRRDGLAADRKAKTFRDSYRGQRREARQHKQGFTSFRERLLREWKMEIGPKSIVDRLTSERQEKIEKRLKRGDTAGTLDDDNDDDMDADEAESSSAANDKDNKGKEGSKEEAREGEGRKPTEPSLNDLKRLVRSYTGQFDGRTSDAKFAFMVVDESTKTVDVVPVGDCSMFVFRAEQQGQMTLDEVEALTKQLRLRREKDGRIRHFQDTILESQSLRDHQMGDRDAISGRADMYNPGISRVSAPQQGEDEEVAEDFDFEKEFDNDDLLQVDKDEASKPQKSVLIDPDKRRKDFQRMIKDEPDNVSNSDSEGESQEKEEEKDEKSVEKDEKGKEKGPDRGIKKEENKLVSSSKNATDTKPTSASVRSSPSSPNSFLVNNTTPSGGSGSIKRSGGASPSSGTNRRGTPQLLDLGHLLPPPGTLPNDDHVKAVLKELLKDRSEVPFKELFRYFKHKTTQEKGNMISILKRVSVIKKKEKGLVITWKTPSS